MPQGAEQLMNADRLVELGVARRVDTADAIAEPLRAALNDLVADPERVDRPKQLQAAARAEGAPRAPVVLGEPVLTEAEWLQLQEVVNLVKKTQGPRRVSPVRGFLFCDGPGEAVAPHGLFWVKGGDGTARTRSRTARIRCNGRRAWGVKVHAGTRGLRFEYGEDFPVRVQLGEMRFDGSHARPGPGTVSVVMDPDTWSAELMTHEGEVTRFPLPGGTQELALAA